MGGNFLFSRLVSGLKLFSVFIVCTLLACARALPTRDEQAGITQAMIKAEEQARLAKQYSERAVVQKEEARRALEQAKVYYESALKVQELCRKKAKPLKCPVVKDACEPKKEDSPKKPEPAKEAVSERHAESAVTKTTEKPVEPTLDTTDMDYSPSDAPPGLYEKLKQSGK